MECKFVDFDNFDIEEYEHFENVENGDLTWLSDRICAFAGPHNTHSSSVEGYYTPTPEDYIPTSKRRVWPIVRLNKKYYDEGRFRKASSTAISTIWTAALQRRRCSRRS